MCGDRIALYRLEQQPTNHCIDDDECTMLSVDRRTKAMQQGVSNLLVHCSRVRGAGERLPDSSS